MITKSGATAFLRFSYQVPLNLFFTIPVKLFWANFVANNILKLYFSILWKQMLRNFPDSNFLTADREMAKFLFSEKKLTRAETELTVFLPWNFRFFVILPVMAGARVSVEPNSDKACFFTRVCQFSRKNIKVEFWPKIPGTIPSYNTKTTPPWVKILLLWIF